MQAKNKPTTTKITSKQINKQTKEKNNNKKSNISFDRQLLKCPDAVRNSCYMLTKLSR
jgi:hypothetical protein